MAQTKNFTELAKERHDELVKQRETKQAEIKAIDDELNPIKALLKSAGILEKKTRNRNPQS